VDISFNLVKRGDVQGTPLVDMSVDDALDSRRSQDLQRFITARAAAGVPG